MATVYRADDLRHNRPVAIKVLHSHLAESLGPERFLREIQIAGAAAAPAHRADVRLRPRRRSAVLRHAVRRRRVAAATAPATTPPSYRRRRADRAGRRGGARLRASPAGRPSRHQARERDDARRRSRRHRFRDRQGHFRGGVEQPHADGDGGGDAGVHEPGAGVGRGRDRRASRRLLARRDALRDGDRLGAVHRTEHAGHHGQAVHGAGAAGARRAAGRSRVSRPGDHQVAGQDAGGAIRHGESVRAGAHLAQRHVHAAGDEGEHEVDRRARVLGHEPAARPGLLLRGHRRGDHQRAEQGAGAARRVAHLLVRVQGKERGHQRDRAQAQGRDGARGKRAESGRPPPGDGAAGERGRRISPLVGALRPSARRRVRDPGRDRGEHRQGAAARAERGREAGDREVADR